MISYRFKRRAFLTALGGGVGLKIMLRNMEASAQTASSPPRLLVTHWPVGVVVGASNALWNPPSGQAVGGSGLQPFADAGLNSDMITIRGITTGGLNLNGGGSHEGGTVVLVTGVGCGGTRTNRGEPDDGYAGGPSFEQALLERVAALKSPMGGAGYANSIADTRTDLGEVSTKCLSYGSKKVSVTNYSGASAMQNEPLLPVLSPTSQYSNLFNGFAAGPAASDDRGGADPRRRDADAAREQAERPRLRARGAQPPQGHGARRLEEQAPESLRRHQGHGDPAHQQHQHALPGHDHRHGRHGRQRDRHGRAGRQRRYDRAGRYGRSCRGDRPRRQHRSGGARPERAARAARLRAARPRPQRRHRHRRLHQRRSRQLRRPHARFHERRDDSPAGR